MLKSYKVMALVFVATVSSFGAVAQTETYKDVLLDGKPAKLNFVTGEITYNNGKVATSKNAKKIKDSLLNERTEIKTNLINTPEALSTTQNTVQVTKVKTVSNLGDSTKTLKTQMPKLLKKPNIATDYKTTTTLLPNNTIVSDESNNNVAEVTATETSDFHIVKKGETLYALSQRYKTNLTQLKKANHLDSTIIFEGQTLRVKNFDVPESDFDSVWIVSKGDTLYNIANRNNTTVEDIKKRNGLSSNLILIGQKLQLNQNSRYAKK